ncbi:hypothetical protein ACJMK2_005664 [Sinanodonta woodiana]|uniref:Integrase core domain-containing protein n=1 Tax=Sinanodonta woodiana TaxID=1069815 RepID=A0ABD3T5S1_SINWO
MADAGVRIELIKFYFKLGLLYKDITTVLSVKHGITISERHLRRILNINGLSRHKDYSDVANVLLFISNELNHSGQLHGYRWMHAKCLANGLRVRKEDVRLILSALDPNGCQARKARRLNRREYFAKGPNFIWHIDSYDKLKPYGFCINGCIDGFSRNIVWLFVYHNSSDPRIIGGYFISTVEKLNGVPTLVRGDMGTENCYVKSFQRFLRRNRQNEEVNENAFIEGASTHNQRIECWWGHFRKQCAEFWIDLFQRIRNNGYFSGDILDKGILQFCFMGMIQDEMDEVVKVWNMHLIRPTRNCVMPSGRPTVMYQTPTLYGTQNYQSFVPMEDIDTCRAECLFRETYPCDKEIFDLCAFIMEEERLAFPTDPYEGLDLYLFLRNNIRQDLENLQ